MKKPDPFDAYAYCIQTERVTMDGDAYFKATAQEFPHLEVYEESPASAYEVIVQSIQDLHQAAMADHRPFPAPAKTADDTECSGRVTLRMPKPLHRRLLDQARRNGMPLNTEIVMQLSQTSAMQELASNVLRQVRKASVFRAVARKQICPSYSSAPPTSAEVVMLEPTLTFPKGLITMSGSSNMGKSSLGVLLKYSTPTVYEFGQEREMSSE